MQPALPPKKRRATIAALLSLLTPGLGQLYVGQLHRAVFFYLAVQIVGFGAVAISILPPTEITPIVVSFLLIGISVVVWLFALIDAFRLARRSKLAELKSFNRGWVYLIVIAGNLTLSVSLNLAFEPRVQVASYSTPARSMMPTLMVGDRYWAWKGYYKDHEPEAGDLIIFDGPAGADYVRRVAALPGQEVQVRRGAVFVDGQPVQQIFKRVFEEADAGRARVNQETLPNGVRYEILDWGPAQHDDTRARRVPDGHYYLLCDNRDQCIDSRDFGPVARSALRDRPTYIFWSENKARIGALVQPLP